MEGIIAALSPNEILTAEFAARLRSYISARNPGLSSYFKANIFADAVNRIVDARLPKLGGQHPEKLRSTLYENVISKPRFSIDCSDIFKAAIGMKTLGSDFFKGFGAWLSGTLQVTFSREGLFDFVLRVHKELDGNRGLDITEAIRSVEAATGGLAAELATGLAAGLAPGLAGQRTGVYGPVIEETAADYVIPAPTFTGLPDVFGIGAQDGQQTASFIGKCLTSMFTPRAKAVSALAAAVLTAFISANSLFLSEPGLHGGAQAGTYNQGILLPDQGLHTLVGPGYGAGEEGLEGSMDSIPQDSTGAGAVISMRATAYDLSYQSCGKMPGDPGYGITFSGTRASAGRTIAVDPDVIPLGSEVYITFPDNYGYMDGVYVAEDTGRLIKGNSVDIFFGEDARGSREVNRKAMEFGVRYVSIKLLDN